MPDENLGYWGMLLVLWTAVIGIPYLWFTVTIGLLKRKRDDRSLLMLIGIWMPGFMAILFLSQQDYPVSVGIIITIGYFIAVSLGTKFWQTYQRHNG